MLQLKGYYFSMLTFLLFIQTIYAQNLERVDLDEFDNSFGLLCPSFDDASNPTHLPHPNDCTKFFKCDRGVPVVQDCPNGLHWSIKTDRCEWPNVAQCQKSNGNDSSNSNLNPGYNSTSSQSVNGSNQTHGYDPYPGQNNESDSQSVNGSNQTHGYDPYPGQNNGSDNSHAINGSINYLCQGKNGDLLPYPEKCSKFIQCSNGVAIEFNCPKGLHWNDSVKKCDYQGNANCNLEFISNDNSDELIVVNDNFEGAKNFENLPRKSIRHPGCPVVEDPANPTHLPYPGDCTKFYKCDSGVAFIQNCPSGLHWNANENVCDWPSNAQCIQNILNQSWFAVSHVDGPIKNPNCPLNENPASPTQLPYPGDCAKFYKCFNGYAYPHNCPNGLHWNNNLKVCDWPSNAGCIIQYFAN